MAGLTGQSPSRGIRAVIFDLDGTLVDSAGEIASALNQSLGELGCTPLPRPQVEALIGRGVKALVERALRIARARDVSLADAVDRFERRYAASVGTQAALYPGVRDGLVELEAAGVPMAVVTNKPRFFTERLLERLEVVGFFAACVAGDDGLPRKPAGDMLLAAARTMGVDIDSVLMLGDSGNDVQAGRDAGCLVWCVPYGYNEGHPAESLGADRIVASVAEAARMLLRANGAAALRSL